MEERVQKIMARAGVASRRDCDELIRQGRVTVNGKKIELGAKADAATDTILVDGRKLDAPEPLQYIALYKPTNVISAVTSPDPRPTVRDLVPVPGRLYPVGRLDIESEGLILLTNDGDLANRITHPRFGCDKEYRVLVPREPDEKQLKAWRSGVVLEDGYRTAPAEVHLESKNPQGAWLRIIMHEGRKRQIREIGETLGLPVVRLIRVRIGPLRVGNLKPREWRPLTDKEVRDLRKAVTPGPTPTPQRPSTINRPGARPPASKSPSSRPPRPAGTSPRAGAPRAESRRKTKSG